MSVLPSRLLSAQFLFSKLIVYIENHCLIGTIIVNFNAVGLYCNTDDKKDAQWKSQN